MAIPPWMKDPLVSANLLVAFCRVHGPIAVLGALCTSGLNDSAATSLRPHIALHLRRGGRIRPFPYYILLPSSFSADPNHPRSCPAPAR